MLIGAVIKVHEKILSLLIYFDNSKEKRGKKRPKIQLLLRDQIDQILHTRFAKHILALKNYFGMYQK